MRLDLTLRRDDPVLALMRLHVPEDLLLAFRQHNWTFDQYAGFRKRNPGRPRLPFRAFVSIRCHRQSSH
jgi:hypothetical protein